jgi:hypothetical protein
MYLPKPLPYTLEMDTHKDEAALARRRAQNREAQRKFRREYLLQH